MRNKISGDAQYLTSLVLKGCRHLCVDCPIRYEHSKEGEEIPETFDCAHLLALRVAMSASDIQGLCCIHETIHRWLALLCRANGAPSHRTFGCRPAIMYSVGLARESGFIHALKGI
jgi:hypothetical protein